jgi:hypothetical protein
MLQVVKKMTTYIQQQAHYFLPFNFLNFETLYLFDYVYVLGVKNTLGGAKNVVTLYIVF